MIRPYIRDSAINARKRRNLYNWLVSILISFVILAVMIPLLDDISIFTIATSEPQASTTALETNNMLYNAMNIFEILASISLVIVIIFCAVKIKEKVDDKRREQKNIYEKSIKKEHDEMLKYRKQIIDDIKRKQAEDPFYDPKLDDSIPRGVFTTFTLKNDKNLE